MVFKVIFTVSSFILFLNLQGENMEKLSPVLEGFPRTGLGTSEISFYQPFEETLNATYGRGKTDTLKMSPKDIQWGNGICGKCISTKEKSLSLKYPTEKNLNGIEGAISFWMKPGDWSKLKSGFNAPGIFVSIEWKDKRRITLFNNNWYTLMEANNGHENVRSTPVPEGTDFYIRDKWLHFVLVWQADKVLCYIDGEEKAAVDLKMPFDKNLEDNFTIGCPQFSSLDEVKVFNRALTKSEIESLYDYGTSKPSKAFISVPFCEKKEKNAMPPKDCCTSWTGLIERLTGQISDFPTTVWTSYDDENLYFQFLWKVPKELADDSVGVGLYGAVSHDVGEKDGPVWKDDSFELLFSPNSKDEYRIVVNDRNSVYDSKNGNSSWDSGVKVISEANLKEWNLSLVIPLKSINIPKSGDEWKFNIIRRSKVCGIAYESFFVDSHSFLPCPGGSLRFADSNSRVRISGMGSLKSGLLDFSVCADGKIDVLLHDQKGILKEEKKFSSGSLSIEKNLPIGADKIYIKINREESNTDLFELAVPYSFSRAGEISFTFIPLVDLLNMKCVVSADDKTPKKFIVRILKSGKEVCKKDYSFQGKYGEFKIPVKELGKGDYSIEAYVSANGKELLSKRMFFTKKELPEWVNNKYGLDDIVLKPWEPLTREGNTFKLWNRQFKYSEDLLFPETLLSAGESPLARSVELIIDGKVLKGKNVIESFKKTGLRRSFHADMEGVEINASVNLSYDGMEWYDIKLDPAENSAEISNMKLVIPFKKETAELYFKDLRDAGNIKKLPSDMPFCQILVIRNDLHGLVFFAESPEGYSLKKPSSCIQWKEKGDTFELIINIIDHPFKINKERKIAFGLIPTPIRPERINWRNIRVGKLNNSKEAQPPLARWQFWWTWHGDAKKEKQERFWNNLTPPYDDLRKLYKKCIDSGITPVPYFSLTRMSPFIEEYKYFEEDWHIEPSQRVAQGEKENTSKSVMVCPNSTYSDYFFYRLKSALDETGFRGIYIDCTGPIACCNHYHGCGYTDDDGKMCKTYPYLATREFYRRARTLLEQSNTENKETMLVGHANRPLYVLSGADAAAIGENFVVEVGKHGNYHWISLDHFRALMSPHTGIINFLLPQFARARMNEKDIWFSEQKRPEVEHLCGLVMCHDAKVWPAFSLNAPYREMWKFQDLFGWDEKLEFLPYWNNKKYVKVENAPEDLVVSLYRRPGKLMAVVLNHSDKKSNPKITFNMKELGIEKDALSFVDSLHGNKYELKGNVLEIPINPWSYEALIFKTGSPK
ncbi:MAG: hypothetical protein A2020_07920 [Lentisphaerae bacterium GWF2_45_14]|nr:MAG: hypothetical protein A2020_07920 [Lentisphaerae bacterium GWF2_45_14]